MIATRYRKLARARALVASGQARGIREASYLSQRDIASAAGIAPSTVAHYELGDRLPRGDAGERYAQVLLDLAKSLEAAA